MNSQSELNIEVINRNQFDEEGVDCLQDYQFFFSHGLFSFGFVRKRDQIFFAKSLRKNLVKLSGYRLLLSKEYKLLLKLNDPSIVRVYDLVDSKSLGLTLLMEYIEGETLKEFLKTSPSLKIRRKIASQILDSVCYIHKKGITHCDLTPNNIMIQSVGEDIGIKIIDFGLSDSADLAFLKGAGYTPTFAAPEQRNNNYIPSPKADVWALGKLFKLLNAGIDYSWTARKAGNKEFEKRPESAMRLKNSIKNFRRILGIMIASVIAVLIFGFICFPQKNLNTFKSIESESYKSSPKVSKLPEDSNVTVDIKHNKKEEESVYTSEINKVNSEPNTVQHSFDQALPSTSDSKSVKSAEPKIIPTKKIDALQAEYIRNMKQALSEAVKEAEREWKAYDGTTKSANECNRKARAKLVSYMQKISQIDSAYAKALIESGEEIPDGWRDKEYLELKQYYDAFSDWSSHKGKLNLNSQPSEVRTDSTGG